MRRTAWIVFALLLASPAVRAQAPQDATGAQGRGARSGGGRGAQPGPPPRIVTFEVRPSSINPGESALLVWSTENPAAPAIEPGIGAVTPRGNRQVKPAATTTFTQGR